MDMQHTHTYMNTMLDDDGSLFLWERFQLSFGSAAVVSG